MCVWSHVNAVHVHAHQLTSTRTPSRWSPGLPSMQEQQFTIAIDATQHEVGEIIQPQLPQIGMYESGRTSELYIHISEKLPLLLLCFFWEFSTSASILFCRTTKRKFNCAIQCWGTLGGSRRDCTTLDLHRFWAPNLDAPWPGKITATCRLPRLILPSW